MSSEGSVTGWIGQAQCGEQDAIQKLWERYFHRLVGLARARLSGVPRRAADEEDVALSAFDSFCRGAERGQYPALHSRDSLWRLLVTLTVRKSQHLVRASSTQKRSGPEAEADIELVLSREPSPALAAEFAEECRRLLGQLADRTLQSIAVWKMEGHTNKEIAATLGCAPSTVERRLQLIRQIWLGAPDTTTEMGAEPLPFVMPDP
jgi:DNA-directed RNA polymerase specialized sigma24 family protein